MAGKRTCRKPWIVPAIVALLAPLLAGAAWAQESADYVEWSTLRVREAGPLILFANEDLTRMIVVDTEQEKMLVYSVLGRTVALTAARSLRADAARSEAGQPVEETRIPTRDAPGEDPTGFPRPEGSVRVGFGSSIQPGERQTTHATYLVRGGVGEVFQALRGSFDGWTLESESVQVAPEPMPQGKLRLTRGGDRLLVEMGEMNAPAGYVRLRVSLEQPLG